MYVFHMLRKRNYAEPYQAIKLWIWDCTHFSIFFEKPFKGLCFQHNKRLIYKTSCEFPWHYKKSKCKKKHRNYDKNEGINFDIILMAQFSM
jgi:hypothetical protein